MNDLAILARLEMLERRVEEMSRPPLYFEPAGLEIEPWMADMQRAHAFAGESVSSATIEVSGEIDEANRQRIADQVWSNRSARHLEIVIDSEGGCFHASVAVYRAIRWSPAHTKHVRMLRQCSSGALLIAMAGDRRIAQPGTEILLHLVGSHPSAERRWTAIDHAEAVRHQSGMDRRMLSLIAERTGADFDDLIREASHERPSSLDWCLANGLVHEIEGPAAP
jgi:ATP-dependent protease ClpP protease subunit